jgi:hypothetical protein
MNKYKALLIIGHDVFEYNRIKMFNELGFEVLSTGSYRDPANPNPAKPYLPKLDTPVNEDLLAELKGLNPQYPRYGPGGLRLSKEFVDKFDLILTAWIHEPFLEYWDIVKDKFLIYETIGQSCGNKERMLRQIRPAGVKVLRIADTEERFPNYAGADAIIDLEIDCNYYQGWKGTEEYLFTVNTGALKRKHVANTDLYLAITQNLPKKLYGTDNEDFKADFVHNRASTRDEILEQYQLNRAFFSLGSNPCPVVLSFKEALSVGMPVITWGQKLGGINFKAHKFIENWENGVASDNSKENRNFCERLLNGKALAKQLSVQALEKVIGQL